MILERDDSARGSIEFHPDRIIINLFENAAPFTLMHEIAHLFLHDMRAIASEAGKKIMTP